MAPFSVQQGVQTYSQCCCVITHLLDVFLCNLHGKPTLHVKQYTCTEAQPTKDKLNCPFSLQSTTSAIEEGSFLSNISASVPTSFLSTLCTSSSAPTAKSRTRFPNSSSRSRTP